MFPCIFVLVGMTILSHLHLSVLVRATDGEEPLQGDAEHDVDAGHETGGVSRACHNSAKSHYNWRHFIFMKIAFFSLLPLNVKKACIF